MASIFSHSENSDNLELITKLAQKLGISVSSVSDEQSEDLALGNIIKSIKTGKSVRREALPNSADEAFS